MPHERVSDVVLLLPGFFGFDRFATFYYFADRVSATLRGHLESRLGGAVPVIPLATGPAEGLAARQTCLLAAITQICDRFVGKERVHLVGHSTGGLDAHLLLRRDRLDGKPWTAEQHALRAQIASVTGIASPYYGSTIALSDAVRFARSPSLGRAGALFPAATALMSVLPERAAKGSQLLGGIGSVWDFVRQLVYRRDLLDDLMPERVEALYARNPAELTHVPETCFVTCARTNPSARGDETSKPDAFFLYLTSLTAGARAPASEAVRDNIARLNAPGVPTVASPSAALRLPQQYDEVDNDAVVNSARQLTPSAKLGAIVHADHADVLGHYDRKDPLHPDRYIREGVFRSGAHFGDNEFFELYRRVADAIATAALADKPIADSASSPRHSKN